MVGKFCRPWAFILTSVNVADCTMVKDCLVPAFDRWVCPESFGFFCPGFNDEFVWGQAYKGLEASAVIAGVDEVCDVAFELLMAAVRVAFDGGFFDRAGHSLDLPVVHGCLILVRWCAIPYSRQRMSNMCII